MASHSTLSDREKQGPTEETHVAMDQRGDPRYRDLQLQYRLERWAGTAVS